MADTAPEETLAQLTRLSQKPGVQSTLLLSRTNGAIVRTSGLISKSGSVNPNSALPAPTDDTEAYTNGRQEGGMQSAEDVAWLVFKFVDAAGTLVDGLDKEEEVRLLRVRTRKNELVIVPSMPYSQGIVCNC
jgi:dynein light chain roadblock-type